MLATTLFLSSLSQFPKISAETNELLEPLIDFNSNIDSKPPVFLNFRPETTIDTTPDLQIDVQDLDGLDIGSEEFSYTKDGSNPSKFMNPHRDAFEDGQIAQFWKKTNQQQGVFEEKDGSLLLQDVGEHVWTPEMQTAPILTQTVIGDFAVTIQLSPKPLSDNAKFGLLAYPAGNPAEFVAVYYEQLSEIEVGISVGKSEKGTFTPLGFATLEPTDPIWLKLVRIGNEWVGAYSMTGSTYEIYYDLGSSKTSTIDDTIQLGLFAVGGAALFDNWMITPYLECLGLDKDTTTMITAYKVPYNQNHPTKNRIVFRMKDVDGNLGTSSIHTVNTLNPDLYWRDSTLFADGDNIIYEIDTYGEIIWSFDASSLGVYSIADVERLPGGRTMFIDMRPEEETEHSGIYIVNSEGEVTWSYVPQGADQLRWTHDVDFLPTGNLLIADTGNERVFELDYETKTIEWIYHTGPGSYPNDCDRLPTGPTLITLRDYDQVIEVSSNGTYPANIVWFYGEDDSFELLNGPHNADRVANGNTLIADSNNNRIVEVTPDKEVVWEFAEDLAWPRDADRLPNGNTLIADSDNYRLIEIDGASDEIIWQYDTYIGVVHGPYCADRLDTTPPNVTIILPLNETYSTTVFDVLIQSDAWDLDTIWYRIYDETVERWLDPKNVTTTGRHQRSFEDGHTYTIWAWGNDTGFLPQDDIHSNIQKFPTKITFSVNTSVIIDASQPYPGVTLIGLSAVNMDGEYLFRIDPEDIQHLRPRDTEWLPNGNILFGQWEKNPGYDLPEGVYEITPEGEIVWGYPVDIHDPHDVDRLPNGNTLIASTSGHEVIEIDPDGNILMEWKLREWFPGDPKGWTNDADRLPNGLTMISARDLYGGTVLIINATGHPIWTYGGLIEGQSNLEMLDNGNMLIADTKHDRVIEVNPDTKEIVWTYFEGLEEPRDAEYLKNGNILIADTGHDRVLEVTKAKGIVWQWNAGDWYSIKELGDAYIDDVDRLPDDTTLISCRDLGGGIILIVNATGHSISTFTGLIEGQYNSELLNNGNLLIADTNHSRVIEINTTSQEVVWIYDYLLDSPRDAEQLANGNILIADTGNNRVLEVTRTKEVVWQWIAWDWFEKHGEPSDVDRMPDGTTLISLERIDFIVRVNATGHPIWKLHSELDGQHNVDVLTNGNMLISDSGNNRVIEINMTTKEIVWEYAEDLNWPRDADRLPNGNTLITDTRNERIIEVNSTKHIVWEYDTGGHSYEADRVDITPPVASIQSPWNTSYPRNSVDISLSCYAYDLDTLFYRIHDDTRNQWVDPTNTTWTKKETRILEDGQYTMFAYANDTGFRMTIGGDDHPKTQKVPSKVTFTIDTVPPSVISISPQNRTYTSRMIEVNLASSDADLAGIFYRIFSESTKTWIDQNNITWNNIEQRSLGDGEYTLYVWAEDASGHTSTVSTTFTIETGPPTVKILSPLERIYVDEVEVVLSCPAQDLDTMWYQIYSNTSQEWVNKKSVVWTAPTLVTLEEGEYILFARGNDTQGNIQMIQTQIYFVVSRNPGKIVWGQEIRLTFDGKFFSENPFILVDSQDRIHLVWEDETCSGIHDLYNPTYCIYYMMFNGTNWSPAQKITEGTIGAMSPVMTEDSQGRLWLVWVDARNGSPEIYYKIFDGLHWSSDERLTTSNSLSIAPTIATDSQGNVYIVWQDDREGINNFELYYKKYDGVSWNTDSRITNSPGSSESPTIAIDSQDNVHIVWIESKGSNSNIYYTSLVGSDLAKNQILTDINSRSMMPNLIVDSQDILHLVWADKHNETMRIYYMEHDQTGWGTEEGISSAHSYSTSPTLAIDSFDNVYVIWTSQINQTNQLYFSRKIGESGWILEQNIMESLADHPRHPALALDSRGVIHVVWTDFRDGSYPIGNTEIYYKQGERVVVLEPQRRTFAYIVISVTIIAVPITIGSFFVYRRRKNLC